jgi:hypothetical protein
MVGEVSALAASAASGVEGDTRREAVDDLADDRLLDAEQPVLLVVVRGGPLALPLDTVQLGCGDADSLQRRSVKQPADLGGSSIDELLVEVTAERLQQCDAFQADQVRERVLIHHERGP